MLDATIFNEIANAYDSVILDEGQQPLLLMLVAFVATFGITRFVTHSIRANRFPWLGNVAMGDTHVHHLVWGILLLLVTGFVALAFDPGPPKEILAIFFGIGAALTLDEFAMWLHLEDVYWAEKGRASIDAVILTVVFLGLAIVWGFPVLFDTSEGVVGVVVPLVIVIPFWICAAITVMKGKLRVGVVAFFIPLVGLVSAWRLAKPDSPWARKRYDKYKLARARKRFKSDEEQEEVAHSEAEAERAKHPTHV